MTQGPHTQSWPTFPRTKHFSKKESSEPSWTESTARSTAINNMPNRPWDCPQKLVHQPWCCCTTAGLPGRCRSCQEKRVKLPGSDLKRNARNAAASIKARRSIFRTHWQRSQRFSCGQLCLCSETLCSARDAQHAKAKGMLSHCCPFGAKGSNLHFFPCAFYEHAALAGRVRPGGNAPLPRVWHPSPCAPTRPHTRHLLSMASLPPSP